MDNLFDIITEINGDDKEALRVSIGIKVKIAGKEMMYPVTEVYNSYETFENCVNSINAELENLLKKAHKIYHVSDNEKALDLENDATPEDIWNILSSINDEKQFMDAFNNLSKEKRREIADYVLTHCNIFTGKGAFFSSQYNQQTGLLGYE